MIHFPLVIFVQKDELGSHGSPIRDKYSYANEKLINENTNKKAQVASNKERTLSRHLQQNIIYDHVHIDSTRIENKSSVGYKTNLGGDGKGPNIS